MYEYTQNTKPKVQTTERQYVVDLFKTKRNLVTAYTTTCDRRAFITITNHCVCYNKIRTFAEVANVAQHAQTCHATRADVFAVSAIFTRTVGTDFHPCCPPPKLIFY